MTKPNKPIMTNARILNVSLDHALLMTRHVLLQQAGHNVTSVSNWTDFEQAFSQGLPELIILGQTLPPSWKHDMAEFAKKHSPHTKVAEIYLFAPSLPAQYIFHAKSQHDPEEFVQFVNGIQNGSKA